MNTKYWTLLLTSNDLDQTRQWSVSQRFLKWCVLALLALAILLIFICVDYFRISGHQAEIDRLNEKNKILEQRFSEINAKLLTSETQVDKVQSMAIKLDLITSVDQSENDLDLKFDQDELVPGNNLEPHLQKSKPERDPFQFLKNLFGFKVLNNAQGSYWTMDTSVFDGVEYRIENLEKKAQLTETKLSDLWSRLSEKKDILISTPSISPVRGTWLSSRFGYRIDPFTGQKTLHRGLDFAGATGTPVYSTGQGIVSYAGFDSGYGKVVSIDHGFGLVTRYAHLSKIYVKLGDKINRGIRIADVGSTGRSSGPHLHYEVRKNGIPVNPKNYILTSETI